MAVKPAAVYDAKLAVRLSGTYGGSQYTKFEAAEGRDHLVGAVAQRGVAADEVEVDVRQPGLASRQATARHQIEEHGAAAQKGFEVAVEA